MLDLLRNSFFSLHFIRFCLPFPHCNTYTSVQMCMAHFPNVSTCTWKMWWLPHFLFFPIFSKTSHTFRHFGFLPHIKYFYTDSGYSYYVDNQVASLPAPGQASWSHSFVSLFQLLFRNASFSGRQKSLFFISLKFSRLFPCIFAWVLTLRWYV